MTEDTNLADMADVQIEQQGVAVFRVTDGHVFVFTLAVLEALVESAQKEGKAIVFVKRGAEG